MNKLKLFLIGLAVLAVVIAINIGKILLFVFIIAAIWFGISHFNDIIHFFGGVCGCN